MRTITAVAIAFGLAGCEYALRDDRPMDPAQPPRSAAQPSVPGAPPSSSPALSAFDRDAATAPAPSSPDDDASTFDAAAPTPAPSPCEGTATACKDLGLPWCDQQEGCVLDEHYECTGTAAPCGTFVRKTTCEQQWGCTWAAE